MDNQDAIRTAVATGVFERVALQTADGSFLQNVVVPRFTPPAEMVMWGSRTFRLHTPRSEVAQQDIDQPTLTYRECFAYYVVPVFGLTMNGLDWKRA